MPTRVFEILTGADDATVFSDGSFVGGGEIVGPRRSSGQINANGLLRFDTSSLPDEAVVTGVNLVFTINLAYSENALNLTADYYNWLGAASDYSAVAQTSAIEGIPLSSFPSGGAGTAPLTGLWGVNTRGLTTLRLHISGANPSGTNQLSFNAKEGSSPARLEVTYTTPPVTSRLSPQFRAASSNFGQSDSISVARPSGTVEGDEMLVCLSAVGGTNLSTPVAPPGWELLVRDNRSNALASIFYRKTATASEPTSYSFGIANVRWAYVAASYYDTDLASPVKGVSGPTASETVGIVYDRPTYAGAATEGQSGRYVTLMAMRHAALRPVTPVTGATERVESDSHANSPYHKAHLQDEPESEARTAKQGGFSGGQQYNCQVSVMLQGKPTYDMVDSVGVLSC